VLAWTACEVLPNGRGKVRLAERRGPTTTLTKDDIQLLYEYDRWANNRVFAEERSFCRVHKKGARSDD